MLGWPLANLTDLSPLEDVGVCFDPKDQIFCSCQAEVTGLVSINGVNMGTADFRVYIKPIDRVANEEPV
jgi:hypothetical protein